MWCQNAFVVLFSIIYAFDARSQTVDVSAFLIPDAIELEPFPRLEVLCDAAAPKEPKRWALEAGVLAEKQTEMGEIEQKLSQLHGYYERLGAECRELKAELGSKESEYRAIESEYDREMKTFEKSYAAAGLDLRRIQRLRVYIM
jgi:predicted RNase H-like nuclease (RuvC/YqgF family)